MLDGGSDHLSPRIFFPSCFSNYFWDFVNPSCRLWLRHYPQTPLLIHEHVHKWFYIVIGKKNTFYYVVLFYCCSLLSLSFGSNNLNKYCRWYISLYCNFPKGMNKVLIDCTSLSTNNVFRDYCTGVDATRCETHVLSSAVSFFKTSTRKQFSVFGWKIKWYCLKEKYCADLL